MPETSITKEQLQQAVANISLPATVSDLNFDSLGEVGALLAEMHSEGTLDGISYFEALPFAELSDRDRTRMAYVLQGFLGNVHDTTERVISLVHTLRDNASAGLAYQIRQGFEAWMADNPAQITDAAKLVEARDRDSEFLGLVLHAWRKVAPTDAISAAVSFSGSKWPEIRRQATIAIGSFEYTDQEEVQRAETRLADLIASDDVEDQRTAIFSIGCLLDKQSEKSDRLVAELEKASDKPSEDIRHELIAGLVYHRNAYPQPLREKIFALMRSVQSDRKDTLDLVDQALFSMNIDTDRTVVLETLTAILTQETGAPSLRQFDALVHKVATARHEIHSWYVTSWLLDGQYQICKQIDVIFPPLDKSVYNFQLDAFRLNEAEVLYLAHKIYAYLMFSHGPAVSLLSACLMSLKPKNRKRLEEDITAFWLRNYPSDLDLFDTVHASYPHKGLKVSIQRMRRQVNEYQAPLRSLPRNSAMQPSTLERHVQAEIAREQNKEIGRVADENSIFANLFHKSTLLYGRSSVIYVYPDSSGEPIRQVMELQNIEASSALPHMDVLYPARLNYLIYRFRVERRPT